MTPEIITSDEQFQCRHIFTDGRRCGSPAIRGPEGADSFCYFHHNSRRPIQDAPIRKRRQSRFALPNPEDRSAIQQSIGEVLRRIASNEIDPRRAGLLLYGLQIASLNLPPNTKKPQPREEASEFVTEITHDPQHGMLAPPAELHANRPKSSIQLILEEFDARDQEHTTQPIDIHASASADEPNHATPETPRTTERHRSPHRHRILPASHERMSSMSDFIPKPTSPKLSGLGPKAQKLAAMREKAAQANTNATAATSESTSASKPKNSVVKKTAFQRKAT